MKGLSFLFLAAILTLVVSCAGPLVPVATHVPPTFTPAPSLTFTPKLTITPVPTATFTPVPEMVPTPTLIPTLPSPTFTPARPAAAFTPETVTIELSEAELADSYETWIKDVGLSVETVDVNLADEKMAVLMKNVGISTYMLEEFKMVGAYTVLEGKLKYQPEKVVPDAPWVWVITPTADDVMAGMTKDVYVTEIEIVDGKIVINGLKTAS